MMMSLLPMLLLLLVGEGWKHGGPFIFLSMEMRSGNESDFENETR
jgi:hypothetical protein